MTKFVIIRETAGFRRDIDKICCLLEFYAESSGNSLPTFRDNVSVSSSRVKKSNKKTFFFDFFTVQDGTDRLPQNVGQE